ncbi:MAG: type II toxin-antitoxin system HicB family antitoxin [Desulfosalsimonas sp.]|uniref:type II toxin-antitoxin system HicB family antitoxin n=1 Tax=Desulfosalsimonas sp. TaxID=3073848 RepID=UPI003970A0B5
MTHIEMTVKLPISIKKKDKWFIACCPILDVFSQGKTESKARENLADALYLFLTSCYERGTLDEVLRESGIRPAKRQKIRDYKDYIDIPFNLLSEQKQPRHCHA